jgi:YggT family protein
MFNQIGALLFDTLLGLVVYLALLRFFMQLFRAPFRNPVGQFVIALTDWGVQPLRRVVPGLKGMDLSSLALAIVVQLVLVALLYYLFVPSGAPSPGVLEWLLIGVLETVRKTLHLLVAVVIVDVILSWVNPNTPFAPLLQSVTRPLYGVFRKFIPPVGGFDLSPLVLLLVLQVCFIVLNNVQSTLMRVL